MSRVCVVTAKARAYYALVTRLRRAGIAFESLVPGSDSSGFELVLTTKDEASPFGARAAVLEDLDENPGIFKGQIVSRLSRGGELVLVGVDPGKRTGLAVFYGQTRLAFNTFESAGGLASRVGAFASGLPEHGFVIRIGNGNRWMAGRLAEVLKRSVPRATIEIVDESGTSAKTARLKGIQGDQSAAARIAFRRGEVIGSAKPRTRD